MRACYCLFTTLCPLYGLHFIAVFFNLYFSFVYRVLPHCHHGVCRSYRSLQRPHSRQITPFTKRYIQSMYYL